jgi:CDP-paratose 2-epimerase
MIEAISASEQIAGRELRWELIDEPRIGDHRWWISDLKAFRDDYPAWDVTYNVDAILREIYERNVDSWSAIEA